MAVAEQESVAPIEGFAGQVLQRTEDLMRRATSPAREGTTARRCRGRAECEL